MKQIYPMDILSFYLLCLETNDLDDEKMISDSICDNGKTYVTYCHMIRKTTELIVIQLWISQTNVWNWKHFHEI